MINTILKNSIQGELLEAFDRVDDVLNAARKMDEFPADVVHSLQRAKDELFSARVALDEDVSAVRES